MSKQSFETSFPRAPSKIYTESVELVCTRKKETKTYRMDVTFNMKAEALHEITGTLKYELSFSTQQEDVPTKEQLETILNSLYNGVKGDVESKHGRFNHAAIWQELDFSKFQNELASCRMDFDNVDAS